MKIFNCALHRKLIKDGKLKPKFTMLKFLIKSLTKNKKVISLFLNRFRLQIDRIVDGRRFQSLRAAQLNVLTFGDSNKIQES